MTKHEELQRRVHDSEAILRETWSRHRDADDILVLCDLRREDDRAMCVQQQGEAIVSQTLDEAARRDIVPTMAILQPRRFVDALARSVSFAHRETAKELRQFVNLSKVGMGHVPLLVLDPEGMWATLWAEPGSNVVVVRYEPDTPTNAN